MSNSTKIPETKHSVNSLIKNRWSARSFKDQAIGQETLEKLFEAASWAASSMNEQPWKYLYAHRGSDGFDRMVKCLMDGNQPWARDASVMLVCLSKKHFDRNGKPNRHHMHDVGAANTTLLLEAVDNDIYGHMMGGFHMDKSLEEFDIDSENWEIACFMALGYRAEAEALEEPFQSRETTPRSRKDVQEFTKSI